ncbi:lasso peptide biosynthesis B2 protein [Steroidobacter flavus]|uniref:Lasso peptide biosynthesis B2 protein n=1 Tax=Steroidobacter flavus TaxID=1842136 RepID=A0ABV8SP20_9GAMM
MRARLNAARVTIYLRHGVHMCLVDEGAIFLDISTNAYVGIDAETQCALTTCLAGLDSGQNSAPPDTVLALMRRGLLTDSQSLGRPFSPLTVSLNRALPYGTGRHPRPGITAIHLVRFLSALTRVSIMIRRGRLLPLITRLTTLKASASLQDLQSAFILVRIFRRLSTAFYTAKNACLLDSLVLTEFLIKHGHRPTLLIGICTKPFLAHAWVQIEDCALNDSLEHAQTFIPLAAL